MKIRIWSKPLTQEFIKRLRRNGYEVAKVHGIYKCFHDETLVFTAMPGSRGYLCRINDAYITEVPQTA